MIDDGDGWVTRDFVALTPGWMVKYVKEDGTVFTDPVPGVLIQKHKNGDVRVVAADFVGAEMEPLQNADGMALATIYYEHRNHHRESREIRPSGQVIRAGDNADE